MTEQVGDISSRWDDEEVSIAGRSWARSPQQRINTRYGDDFGIQIDMQKITTDQTHRVIREEPICTLQTFASECANDPELAPHALAIQVHLTALTEVLWRRWKETNQPPAEAEANPPSQG